MMIRQRPFAWAASVALITLGRPAFDAARNEAEQTLDKRGIKKGFGYVHSFESEVDAILWQKYQIKRRGFWELNPGIILD